MTDMRPCMQTYTGIAMHPLHPNQEEINIIDIAHALSMVCRFSGMCRKFYSIAEHAVRTSWIVSPQYAFWALNHEDAEAYLGDCITPLKRYSNFGPSYCEHEAALMEVICDKFGLQRKEPAEVKKADMILLMTEKRDLLGKSTQPWYGSEDVECLKERIFPWPQEIAEARFLARFKELYRPAVNQ